MAGGRWQTSAKRPSLSEHAALDTNALIELAKSRALAGLTVSAAPDPRAVGVLADDLTVATGEMRPMTRAALDGRSPQVAARESTASSTVVVPRPGRSRRTNRAIWGFRLVRIGGILLGLILLGFGVSALLRSCQSAGTGNAARQDASTVQPTASSSPSPTNPAAIATLDNATAEQVLKQWLDAKSAAMGPDYATVDLAKVLADPKLSYWQNASSEAKRDNWYKKYKHDVKVTAVQASPEAPRSD